MSIKKSAEMVTNLCVQNLSQLLNILGMITLGSQFFSDLSRRPSCEDFRFGTRYDTPIQVSRSQGKIILNTYHFGNTTWVCSIHASLPKIITSSPDHQHSAAQDPS